MNWLTKIPSFWSSQQQSLVTHQVITTSHITTALTHPVQHCPSHCSSALNLHQCRAPADAVDLVYDLHQAPHTSSCTEPTTAQYYIIPTCLQQLLLCKHKWQLYMTYCDYFHNLTSNSTATMLLALNKFFGPQLLCFNL